MIVKCLAIMSVARDNGLAMKKLIVLVAVLVVLGGGYLYWAKAGKYIKEPVPDAIPIGTVVHENFEEVPEVILGADKKVENEEKKPLPLPKELNLSMPFYSQAPFGNWDYPWQEACEEASVLLVANAYYDYQWSKEEFRDEILRIIEWEMETYGSYEHTDIDQTSRMMNEHLRLRTVIYDNPKYEDLQRMLANGHLVVITFSGKELGNPFYTDGGPVYHAMVLKGYKEGEKLIFHDVGTRRGEDYVYTWDTISKSMRDWAEPISKGEKRVIEVLPPPITE